MDTTKKNASQGYFLPFQTPLLPLTRKSTTGPPIEKYALHLRPLGYPKSHYVSVTKQTFAQQWILACDVHAIFDLDF